MLTPQFDREARKPGEQI